MHSLKRKERRKEGKKEREKEIKKEERKSYMNVMSVRLSES
jgi:hypothetical protein